MVTSTISNPSYVLSASSCCIFSKWHLWQKQEETFLEHTVVADEGDVLAQVKDIVEAMLNAPISPEQPLMEARLDSLGAVELRTALCSHFGFDLPATIVFDYPSISSLATYIAANVEMHPAYSGSFQG
jgi:acyl carrier protein